MGWTIRTWVRLALLLVALGFGNFGVLARQKRQSDWWRSHQRVAPGQDFSRGSLRKPNWGGLDPLYGFGASSGGSLRGHAGGRLRDLPQTGRSPISVQCGEDSMTISVRRDFYKNGRLVKPSDLSLGSQGCKPSAPSTDPIVFQVGLQDCGNVLQMTPDWMIYSTTLTYSPASSANVPITRTSSAVLPINCYYTRHGNVSSKAVRPTWVPFSTTVNNEEKLNFFLRLMDDDWSGPRNSTVYQLGDILYIEASVNIQNHIDLTLFVDNCVATISNDMNSSPRYEIINANGCLVDGKEDSSSAFISPRIDSDSLQFTVDAFRFQNVYESTIYITCQLRVTAATQVPDSMNKACSYSKATSSWSAVEGSNDICRCCDTGTCSAPSGERGFLGSFERGRWKRDIGPHSEEHGLVTLGPLLVIDAQDRSAPRTGHGHPSRTSQEPRPTQLWMLVTVASVSLVLTAATVTLIGKCVLSKLSS
ncbi:zona pellucida sperm-binding protein 3-like [Rana temporaria]|uniref:zona pellucida sperm-binding protein 3-like n=1 Tax=Rana temporaria TaxID=8407 RepID=UPI001AAD716C|nr:zona pellucida sperm-binding protein 3-like [Rana temporaria]